MPTFIFAFVILSVARHSSFPALILTIAILDSPKVFRLARSVAMNVVSLEFVEAARLRGEGWWWIVTREILPNSVPPLTAEFGLAFLLHVSVHRRAELPWPWRATARRGLGQHGQGLPNDMINLGSAAPLYPAAAIAIL